MVVIDEASQMLPQYAIGSIMRAKQLIVVGDSEQMPPSTLFNKLLESDEEEEDEIDEESILESAGQRVGNTVSLRWHYRSRHPSLIDFSNYYFYDNRLQVIPSPQIDKAVMGVKLIYVDNAIYENRLNRMEAQRVIVTAKQSMIDQPEKTIAIVALNNPQSTFIQEEFNKLKDTDPIVREYVSEHLDPLNELLITNLENVQGSERDVVIISSVYGPHKEGSTEMAQRFPLINTEKGHRRLNVLFTRARDQVILVTSMLPSMIKEGKNDKKGKVILRNYLDYAKTGELQVSEETGLEPDSDFEVFVMRALKNAGYDCVPQVGVKGFRIDIGVKVAGIAGRYIAGIECDGATYHSSPQARDRDMIRQDILEGMGWRIYRIWSTDWFSDQKNETAKLLSYLDKIRGKRTTTEIRTRGFNTGSREVSKDVPEEERKELESNNEFTRKPHLLCRLELKEQFLLRNLVVQLIFLFMKWVQENSKCMTSKGTGLDT